MPRDPLAVLARLRRLEVEQARRILASQQEALSAAAARAAAADAALDAERHGAPADYAAFLPKGLAERERAAQALRRAQGSLELARMALADRRTRQRAVEMLAEGRANAARRDAARREQLGLDEHVAARR
ncbi:flagellar FliJ family protein [Falsiroseomonas sp. HW251]|uniref:flagellar FliJ family protein n=1 Tax=Falsiroseomonas sp. HW251 TaxID=3390998 RepID=UPI003D3202AC